jgi:hypothetical protein
MVKWLTTEFLVFDPEAELVREQSAHFPALLVSRSQTLQQTKKARTLYSVSCKVTGIPVLHAHNHGVVHHCEWILNTR